MLARLGCCPGFARQHTLTWYTGAGGTICCCRSGRCTVCTVQSCQPARGPSNHLVEPCCGWFYECLETYEVPLADGRCWCCAQGPGGWLLRWVQHSGSCSSRNLSTRGRTIKLRAFVVFVGLECLSGMLVRSPCQECLYSICSSCLACSMHVHGRVCHTTVTCPTLSMLSPTDDTSVCNKHDVSEVFFHLITGKTQVLLQPACSDAHSTIQLADAASHQRHHLS